MDSYWIEQNLIFLIFLNLKYLESDIYLIKFVLIQ